MIIRGLTTCHSQYTWDRCICVFLFNRTTLQVFVTYLISALCVHPLWFCKHQHDIRVRSFVACQRWWFQLRFWFIESQKVHIWSTYKVCNKTWSVVLLNKKKYIYSYLKCIVYDKLLKPRKSFRITLYLLFIMTFLWPCIVINSYNKTN